MLFDLVSLLAGCIAIFWAKEPSTFGITLVVGIVLAALCWYVCSVYTHYWNRQFRVTLVHHILCGFASLCTLAFVVLFVSLYYTKDAALASIELWQLQLNNDNAWARQTFAAAYDKVKELGQEDFSRFPPPPEGQLIPMTRDESRQTAASVYANEACANFDSARPFLSKIVWSSPGVPSEEILKDTNEWFQTHTIYPMQQAIQIAATQIKEGLDVQVPRVVYLSRMTVAVLFVFAQAIPFGLIGWAAYTDIKVRV